jgi:hypothetical protein
MRVLFSLSWSHPKKLSLVTSPDDQLGFLLDADSLQSLQIRPFDGIQSEVLIDFQGCFGRSPIAANIQTHLLSTAATGVNNFRASILAGGC